MELSEYRDACKPMESELLESLSPEDINRLREDMKALGWKAWLEWCRDNYDDILSFVTATPSRRKRRKAWQDNQLRCRMALASIQHVQRAERLLRVLSDKLLDGSWSAKDMAAHAGDLYIDVVVPKLPRWPFDGPNPFPRGQ